MGVVYQHKETTLTLTGEGFILSNRTISRIEQWLFFPVIIFIACHLMFGIIWLSIVLSLLLGALNFIVRAGSKFYYTEVELKQQRLIKRKMFRKKVMEEKEVSPHFQAHQLKLISKKQGRKVYVLTYGEEKPMQLITFRSKKIKQKLADYLKAFA